MVLSLANPYLTKLVIDKAYKNKDMHLFITLVGAGAVIFILNNCLSSLSSYLKSSIRIKIKFNLNREAFTKLQSLPYSFFQSNATGQNIYKFSHDIESVSSFISDIIPQLILIVMRSVFVMAVIFYLNWKLALLAVILMPFIYFIPYYINKKMRDKWKTWLESSQALFNILQETLSHIKLVKSSGREFHQKRLYVKELVKNVRSNLDNQRFQIKVSLLNSLCSRFLLGAVLFYGGYQVITGEIPLGSLIAIGMYLGQFSGQHHAFAALIQQVVLNFVSCERLDTILKGEPLILENKDAVNIKFADGNIEFKNITFSYDGKNNVFNNLSFSIPGGSCIGLAGPSGSGKTTLINLFLKLYGFSGGEILVDGKNIYDIKSLSFYSQTGVALQDSYLWNDTIENNIKYTSKDAGEEDIRKAAGIAAIDIFIEGLPEGYKTVIGENASKISEGQKQRISIARAVVKKPKILILDEALSSVDGETEAKIIDNIRSNLKDSTVIIISHRVSTIKKMDKVYFLSGPDSMVMGSHDELLKENGLYRKYLASQVDEMVMGDG